MAYFSNFMCFRLRKEELDAMHELMDKFPDRFPDCSRVVRCAIINLLRDERRWEANEIKRNKKRSR
jgi:hypothetical protein